MDAALSIATHQLHIISAFGDNIILVIVAFLITNIYLLKSKHTKTLFIFNLSPISYLYSIFLKYLFLHPRPDSAIGRVYWFDVYGFPSSHVLFYTVFWGFIIYITYKYIKDDKLIMHVVRWVGIYMIIFIGASRVILGMHFVKDVIGGYFFGLIYLMIMLYLERDPFKIFSKN